MIYDPTTVLLNAIGSGRRADSIVAIDTAIDTLVKDKVLLPSSRVGIARTTVGLAKRAGSAPIDTSTPTSFINALRAKKSIVFSQSGASGIFFDSLIEKLGISAEIRGKAIVVPKVSPLSYWIPARPNWPRSR
jgi:molybdate transport system substrate-binding protein